MLFELSFGSTMSKFRKPPLRAVLLLALTALACASLAPRPAPPTPPPATVVAVTVPAATATRPAPPTPAADGPTQAAPPGSGPYQVRGSFEVSNGFVLETYILEHAVGLADMRGFILRDEEWPVPVDSQVLGYMDVDLDTLSGAYDLNLPVRPEGEFNDVDQDGGADTGVQVFAVAYWPNLAGGPFSEGDDPSFGWPSYLASVKTDSENNDEVIGGTLIVWAPDAQQQFPTGFGADGRLFTDDDPVGPLPAGYSAVNLDTEPFSVAQTPTLEADLYEPQDFAIKDFSAQSYTEAFQSLYDLIVRDWAFNGISEKAVDWPALYERIAPRVAEAERDQDGFAFYLALRDFTLAIPDGHVGLNGGRFSSRAIGAAIRSGYGFALREIEGGEYAVVYITEGGPADRAGLRVGARVTEFGGRPIAEAVAQIEPLTGPFSQAIFKRYDQAWFLTRAPAGTSVTVTFLNPDARAAQTVTLTAVDEQDSFFAPVIYPSREAPDLPVTFRTLDSGIGYIQISSYYDDLNLIIRLFDRALKKFESEGVEALIIDLRDNGGGNPLGLAGFLTEREIPLGQPMRYSEQTGQFEPVGPPDKIRPNKTQYRFERIAVLVGPACASACEAEAYGFSQLPGAIVVGFYPSAGVFADVARGQVELPEDMSLQFSTDRMVNADGSLFLEGTGVVPTVRVPLTLDNILSDDDVVLQAAEEALQ